MEHLLKFFGESGKHLEPRTRFLISVVTKVINFSPRGLEQYVKRALKEGATPDQVIDAVLCSYPCAGLTKVVDAIDVILDMGLPGFEKLGAGGASAETPGAGTGVEALPATSPACGTASSACGTASSACETASGKAAAAPSPRWVSVASPEELPQGAALHVVAGTLELALFNLNGTILAVDHHCPHKQGPLARGQVSGTVVSCPLHGWKFDLKTGESVNHPGARLRTYPVQRSEANQLEVLLPA